MESIQFFIHRILNNEKDLKKFIIRYSNYNKNIDDEMQYALIILLLIKCFYWFCDFNNKFKLNKKMDDLGNLFSNISLILKNNSDILELNESIINENRNRLRFALQVRKQNLNLNFSATKS